MTAAEPPSKAWRARLASHAVSFAATVLLDSISVQAQESPPQGGVPIIRDAEIEQLLRDYSKQIFRVAGLSDQNAGTLMESTTPNQVIGVLAHETGHIVGGHLAKMRQELANAQVASIVGMPAGAGALIAGAHSGNVGMADTGGAIMQAPQSYIQHSLLAYRCAQEEYADHAGVRFLTETGQSAKGMYDSAQTAFARGDNKTARGLAERARQQFQIGSPGRVRADDIVQSREHESALNRAMKAKGQHR